NLPVASDDLWPRYPAHRHANVLVSHLSHDAVSRCPAAAARVSDLTICSRGGRQAYGQPRGKACERRPTQPLFRTTVGSRSLAPAAPLSPHERLHLAHGPGAASTRLTRSTQFSMQRRASPCVDRRAPAGDAPADNTHRRPRRTTLGGRRPQAAPVVLEL